jgi:serine/threonine protein kinase
MKAPKPSNLLGGRYQIIRPLARGGFGQTYLAEDVHRPSNPKCVVKQLKPATRESEFLDYAQRLFEREAETLERLGRQHDQIPRLLAYFVEGQEFYLVQDFVDGHALSVEIQPNQVWTEEAVLQMLQDVLNVLVYVHSEGVIHRDIKPDNLIRRSSDHRLVLVDFGTVKEIRTHQNWHGPASVTIAVGTPGYMPTEQHQGRPRANSDIYALGIVAIQALTGLAPHQLQEDAATGEIIWQPRSIIRPELVTILNRMVCYYFRDRYQSAVEVLHDLDPLICSYPAIASPPQSAHGVAAPQAVRQPAPTIASPKPSAPRPPAPAAQPSYPSPANSSLATANSRSLQSPDVPSAQPISSQPQPATAQAAAPPNLPATQISSSPPPDYLVSARSPQVQRDPARVPSETIASPINPSQPTAVSLKPAEPAAPSTNLLSNPSRSTAVSFQPVVEPSTPTESTLIQRIGVGLGVGVLATILIAGNSLFSSKTWWTADASKSNLQSAELDATLSPLIASTFLVPSLPCQEPAVKPLAELTNPPKNYRGAKYYAELTSSGIPVDGRVTVVFPSGDRYDGDYRQGQFEGCGTYTYSDFGTYSGQLRQSKSNGLGLLAFKNGDRYIGEFQDGKCHGQGTFILTNGTVESGSWKNGEQVNGKLSCN